MMEGFLANIKTCLPSEYQNSVARKLIVECSMTTNGKSPEFWLTVVGKPDYDIRFQKADLDAYMMGCKLLREPCGVVLIDKQTNAIDYLEAGLLNILQTTGYGDVALIFQKGFFICKVRFSYRRGLRI